MDERFTAEVEPLLSRIAVPTHIDWGAAGTWIPVDRAHRLQDAIADSTPHPHTGRRSPHQLDQPVALATDLRHWLAATTAT